MTTARSTSRSRLSPCFGTAASSTDPTIMISLPPCRARPGLVGRAAKWVSCPT